MNLSETSPGLSPEKDEQSEPLDLTISTNRHKSSMFEKRMTPWFHQSEPLDLRISYDNKGSLSPSINFDGQYTNAPHQTGCSQTPNTQDITPVHQLEQIFVKCYLNKDCSGDEHSSKSSPCEILLSVLNVEKNQSFNDDANDTSESNVCGKSLLDKFSINAENVLVNKYNRDFRTEYVHNIDGKSNNEYNIVQRSPERTLKTKSIISADTLSEGLVGREYTNINNRDRNTEENKKKYSAQSNENILRTLLQDEEEPNVKKMRLEPSDPFSQNLVFKPSVKNLKKTGESFLQEGKCFEVAPKLPRCRECSLALQDTCKLQQESDNGLCRFYAFRKLRYSPKGFLATAGFLDPHTDPKPEDLELWKPTASSPLPDLDLQMARFMLTHVGDQFCEICKQEEEAISVHMSEDKTVAWKRLVPGFREMCDVCNTTLFNFHWTCRTCGFAVCIDCYKTRKDCAQESVTVERPWLICVNKRVHDQEKLMLTQIIAADSLKRLGQKAHDVRILLGLPLHCGCLSPHPSTHTISQLDNSSNEATINNQCLDGEFMVEQVKKKEDNIIEKICHYPLDNRPINHVASGNENNNLLFEDSSSDSEKCKARFYSSLRKKLTNSSFNNSTHVFTSSNLNPTEGSMKYADMVEEAVLMVFGKVGDQYSDMTVRDLQTPTRVKTLLESQVLYPDCPHSWLCEGRLLKLSDPSHVGNYRAFQDQWKQGQPVLVSGVLKSLDESLWQPDSFIRDFGDTKNDLVNCITGHVIPDQYMCKFWNGFQNVSEMLKDEKGNPMLLKLKDWPPGEDFAEMLPTRFQDLMEALPMGEYTKRTGQLNLSSRLPSTFARPDLGPKMYIAYGSAIHPTKGTTNLHLDISDAVNVMVYVGIPKDIDYEEYIKEAYRAVDEACFEVLMRRRVRESSEVPGALWHIYSARDVDKIRHLLTKVARERRIKLGPHQDPIHDQNWYLDAVLRERLYREYKVHGCAIVQCLGDAVFIPAGAPHQVRNLLNCIKVAEDFVSPENVSHCLHLTQEFRKLSDFHTNHEDKLQIKNLIYHAVKDSVSVIVSNQEI